MRPTVTVIGGYGAIGQRVAAHLAASGACRVVIAGRNEPLARTAAQALGGDTAALRLDVGAALPAGTALGQVVVNASGPSWRTSLPAAALAIAAGADFVDLGGYDRLHAMPTPPVPRRVLVSAGWMPGVSEVLGRLAARAALGRFGAVLSLETLCGARDHWAAGSAGDMVWHLLQRNGNGWYRDGRWQAAPPWRAAARRCVAPPVGSQWMMAVENPQLAALAGELRGARLTTRLGLIGWRTLAGILRARMVGARDPDGAARILSRAIAAEAGDVPLGFCEVRAAGPGGMVRARLVTRDNLRLTAVAGAEAALTLLQPGAGPAPGIHYLGDAVEPAGFLAKLALAGFPHVLEPA